MAKSTPKKDGSGKGDRKNANRGKCNTVKKTGKGKTIKKKGNGKGSGK